MIYLLRHGLTKRGTDVILGQSDPDIVPITSIAREAIKQIIPEHPKVISSPLLRAKQTASYLFEEFTTDSRLMEMDFGKYSGLPAIEENLNKIYALQQSRNSRIHAGETVNEFVSRIDSFYKEINDQDDILLITHSGWIRVLLIEILQIADKSFDLDYLDIIKLDPVNREFDHIQLECPKVAHQLD